MLTAAEMAAAFADLARGHVTAGQARAVIDSGLALLDTLEGDAESVQAPAWVHIAAAIQRTRERLTFARERLEGIPDGQTIAPGSDLWRDVVGPVIAGTCYGPPYCDADLAAGFGGAMPIAPVGAEPYAIASAVASGREAANFAWSELLRDLERGGRKVAGAVAWVGQTALAAAIGYFVWSMFEDE